MSQKKVFRWTTITLAAMLVHVMIFDATKPMQTGDIGKIVLGIFLALVFGAFFGAMWAVAATGAAVEDIDYVILAIRSNVRKAFSTPPQVDPMSFAMGYNPIAAQLAESITASHLQVDDLPSSFGYMSCFPDPDETGRYMPERIQALDRIINEIIENS